MVTEPTERPVATPVALLIEAMVVLLLIQVPPVEVLVSDTLALVQTVVGPEIVPAEVGAPTFTAKLATEVPQLLVTVYCTVSSPALMPPTVPVLKARAWPLVALQVPPETVSERVMPEPTHTLPGPVIVPASGNGFTVTLAVAEVVPQPVVTE